MLASVLYASGVPWVRTGLDGFWAWSDGSIDRLRLLGSLIPAAVAFIAHRVYASDRWWKRAEWALDTATDGDYARRTVGMKALAELSELPMADAHDRQLFNGLVVAVRDAEASRLPFCRKAWSRRSRTWTIAKRPAAHIPVMTAFLEHQHPHGDTGRFTAKDHPEAELELGEPAIALSEATGDSGPLFHDMDSRPADDYTPTERERFLGAARSNEGAEDGYRHELSHLHRNLASWSTPTPVDLDTAARSSYAELVDGFPTAPRPGGSSATRGCRSPPAARSSGT